MAGAAVAQEPPIAVVFASNDQAMVGDERALDLADGRKPGRAVDGGVQRIATSFPAFEAD